MFNGSENFDDDYFKATEKLGATGLNGTTNKDRTNYFQNVPTNAVDRILWLESDRMGNLLGAITQEKLDEQRGVVQNEKRQRQNSPYGAGSEIQYPSIYPSHHPYSWTTIGSMDDLNAATLEDVKQWFKKYYGPNNTVIAIAGDVEPAAILEKVKHYFAEIPPGPPLTKHQSWVAKLTGTQKQISYDRVSETMMMKSWNIEGNSNIDTTYLDLAAAILTSGKTSRLYKRLVYDEQLVSSISAYTAAGEIAGTWEITAMINQGVDEAKVDRIIDEELALFLKKGPTKKELERVKIQAISGFVRGIERIGGFGGKSDILASNYIYTGDRNHFKKELKWIKDASRQAIKQAAVKWLSDGLYQLEIRPFPDNQASNAKVDRTQMPTLGPAPDSTFDQFEKATLKNGMQVIVATRNAIPVIRVQLSIDAGYASDQFSTAGVAKLAMNMLDEGTNNRTSLEINEALILLGASVSSGSNLDTSVVSLSTLTTTLDDSLDIFADVVLNPAFPEKELTRLKLQQLNAIKREQLNPQSMALRVFPKLIYGAGHAYANPYSGSGNIKSVNSINADHLKSFHDTWFKPDHATMIVVGDITMGEVLPKLEAHFSNWQAADIPEKNISTVSLNSGIALYLIDRPDSPQSVLLAGHVATPKANPDEIATIAMNDVLGGMSTSRINMNLREDKHWSYGAGSGLNSARGQRFFYVLTSVQSDKTKESIEEIMQELNQYITNRPITAEELSKSKKGNTLTLPGRWETASSVLGSISQIVQYDLEDDYFDTYARQINQLSTDTVAAVAKRIIHPESLVWIIVGDRKVIEPELNKLGFGKVMVIDSEGNPQN
ncbi:MAG: insulinase family protein [Pseudomonadales bacterium]|nr:insulinase family protein [Pseudomonadales bacterium]